MTWPTCKTCPHWLPRGTPPPGNQQVGSCKRYPPTPMVGAGQVLPAMGEQDWCGEHPERRGGEARERMTAVFEAINPPKPMGGRPPPKRKAKG